MSTPPQPKDPKSNSVPSPVGEKEKEKEKEKVAVEGNGGGEEKEKGEGKSELKGPEKAPEPVDFLTDIIKKLLQAKFPPKAILISAENVFNVLDAVEEKYKATKCALVECNAPINVCGDTHGQYTDLLRIFNACGAPTKAKYLFLGDYIDRGRHSLEVIVLLLTLKAKLPRNIFLLRGNHELKAINKNYGFYAEIRRRYHNASGSVSDRMYTRFNEVFSWMPLCAVISKRVLCMHGGISPYLTSLEEIRKIPLPLETAKTHPLACDLLWADPDVTAQGFEFNKTRAISHIFGEKEVNSLCSRLRIELVIRAHQVVEFGYAFFAARRLITVFSASRYQEDLHNYAAVVVISKNLEVSFVQLKPEEFERRREETGDVREQTTSASGNVVEPEKKAK